MMSLLGSTVDQNTDEEELCCGFLDSEMAVAAIDRLKPIVDGDAKLTDRVKSFAKKFELDEEWCLKNIVILSNALREALVQVATTDAIIVGLYE